MNSQEENISLELKEYPNFFFFPNITEKESKILNEIIPTTKNRVNLPLLRKFCYQDNLKDYPSLRPIFWKVLLGYLPIDVKSWQEIITLNKLLYKDYISIVFTKNNEGEIINGNGNSNELYNENSEKNQKTNDHPLNIKKNSNWLLYFNDKELWNTIEKDTKRTRSEDSFFKNSIKKKYPSLAKNMNENEKDLEQHKDVMTRILFIFAKTHSYIKYVQGMNEILAPIYYCFANNSNSFFCDTIEEDSFTCFSLLMSEIKENFTKIKDCSLLGFKTRIALLDKMLKKIDPKLWQHLNSFSIMTEIYSTRWILLLLTQDFNLTKIMRLWDVLFSYQDKQEFVNFISLAMIIHSRENIMKDNLEEIHLALKKISKGDFEKILELADSIAKEFGNNGEG